MACPISSHIVRVEMSQEQPVEGGRGGEGEGTKIGLFHSCSWYYLYDFADFQMHFCSWKYKMK